MRVNNLTYLLIGYCCFLWCWARAHLICPERVEKWPYNHIGELLTNELLYWSFETWLLSVWFYRYYFNTCSSALTKNLSNAKMFTNPTHGTKHNWWQPSRSHVRERRLNTVALKLLIVVCLFVRLSCGISFVVAVFRLITIFPFRDTLIDTVAVKKESFPENHKKLNALLRNTKNKTHSQLVASSFAFLWRHPIMMFIYNNFECSRTHFKKLEIITTSRMLHHRFLKAQFQTRLQDRDTYICKLQISCWQPRSALSA